MSCGRGLDFELPLKIVKVETVVDYQPLYATAQEEIVRKDRMLRRMRQQLKILRQQPPAWLPYRCGTCSPVVIVVEPCDEILDDSSYTVHRGGLWLCPPVRDELVVEI